MGYSNDDSMVRVDFFKPGGKWYTTLAVKWTGLYGTLAEKGETSLSRKSLKETGDWWDIHKQLAKSLRDHFKDHPNSLCEMDAVCLEPYHVNAHPIQIKAGGWNNLK